MTTPVKCGWTSTNSSAVHEVCREDAFFDVPMPDSEATLHRLPLCLGHYLQVLKAAKVGP
jgi:hypothetical protein